MRTYGNRLVPLIVLLLWSSSTQCTSNDAPPPDDRRETCATGELFCFATDADADGFAPDGSAGSCQPRTTPGCVAQEGDCDDGNGGIRPGATEIADGVDNDCDGEVDEIAVAPTERTDIYWGDTHVHTRFSFDAYVTMSQSERDEFDPIAGELEFARDIREACDFGHYCSRIDFMASTEHAENVPESLWVTIKDQLRACRVAYGPAVTPEEGLRPLHAFAGWEWTQGNPDATGNPPPLLDSSRTQYGHKNIIYPDLEEDRLPIRVVASSAIVPSADQLCSVARLCGTLPSEVPPPFSCPAEGEQETALFLTAFNRLNEQCVGGPPENDPRFRRGGQCFGVCSFFNDGSSCPTNCDYQPGGRGCDLDSVDATVMTSSTCPQFAYTAGGLFELIQSWQDRFDYPLPVIGAHGTTWLNGGHGNWDAAYPTLDDEQDPTMPVLNPGNFRQHEPNLQRFVEVMSKHGSGELYPSNPVEEEFCFNNTSTNDLACFQPTSSDGVGADSNIRYVREGSVQYALAQQEAGVGGDFALNLGLLASTDTHHARPGSTTELPAYGEWESAQVFCDLAGIPAEECPLQYAYAGGLAAVHAAPDNGGVRGAIFRGLRDRQVFGTSGPRIELWFYMTNPPATAGCIESDPGECPMGSVVQNVPTTNTNDSSFVPRFRVHAKGALQFSTDCEDQPAAPGWMGGPEAFHREVCREHCFHETSEADADRSRIVRFEVIRVLRGWLGTNGTTDFETFTVGLDQDNAFFGTGSAGEAIHTVDVIRLACTGATAAGAQNCWAEFEDPQWRTIVERGANAVYYVRALQEETTAYNGPTGTDGELVCTSGEATATEDQTPNCFGPTNERAWSSPIFLFSGRSALRRTPGN